MPDGLLPLQNLQKVCRKWEIFFRERDKNIFSLSTLGFYMHSNYLSHNLPLLTISCPVVATSQSASSRLCQERLLAARPQPSPICPARWRSNELLPQN